MQGLTGTNSRQGRAYPGHPRLGSVAAMKMRLTGINPAMTSPTTIALPLSLLLFGQINFPSPHDFMIYDEY